MTASPTISELVVAADPGPWIEAGFAVRDDEVLVGAVSIPFAGAHAGSWSMYWVLRDVATTDLDGLPTQRSTAPTPAAAPSHPNSVTRLDHVVAFSPDLERSVPALEEAGLDLRRVREGPTAAGAERQAFFRLGETILELVEHPPGTPAAQDREAPSRFYGLAFVTEDLKASVAQLGELLGEPRDAIQPGRRIAIISTARPPGWEACATRSCG